MKDPRLGALRRGRGDAELRGDLVGALEADAEDVDRELVGVLLDDRDRAILVGFVDAYGVRRGHAVGLEEEHHVLDAPLLDPRRRDALAADGADPFDLGEALGLLVDDLQGLHAEVLHEALGHDLADAPDEPRAEVFLDPDESRGLHGDVGLDA